MSLTLLTLLFLLSLSLLHHPPLLAAANLHSTSTLFRPQLISEPTSQNTTPITYFEVTKPINLPKTKPCSYVLLQHDFGYTYGKPPILADYTPPLDCPSQNFAKIVLQWTATCKGRQFDRIFGIWIGGVEVLRSCTAEPKRNGIVWTVEKDITRYYSLLMTNQTLAVYMGNLVDSTYTGVYHVNLSIHFYPAEEKSGKSEVDDGELGFGFDNGADMILPISRNLPLNDGLWFEIENSTDIQSKEFKIPVNVYRAVLEVYVSFHENDEFWYGNYPNEYIEANNLTGEPGNGPFREVVVSLDDVVIGAIWPFTVIYTGGINPLLWRPITAIGSFNLPSYDIEITPLLAKILDGKVHSFRISVTNALNVWYIDANLHLWVDKKSRKTEGKVLGYNISPPIISLTSNFTGLDGSFTTNVSRSMVYSGWVNSSHGKIITKFSQEFHYGNVMVMGNDGNSQIVNQTINFNSSVDAKKPSSSLIHFLRSSKKFDFDYYSDDVDKGNDTYASIANLTLGFNVKNEKNSNLGVFTSTVNNVQNANGYMLVKGNLVVSGLGSTEQEYRYRDDKSCYFRSVSSSNYTVVHDKESNTCGKKLGFGGRRSVPARTTFLGPHFPGKYKLV